LLVQIDIHERPAKGADNVDAILVDALQHLAKECLVVVGSLEVVELGDGGLR